MSAQELVNAVTDTGRSLTRSYMSLLVSGKKDNPSLDLLRTMAEILRVSCGWLAGEDVPRDRPVAEQAGIAGIPPALELAADYELLSPESRRSISHMVQLALRAEARPGSRRSAAPLPTTGGQAGGGAHPFPAIAVYQAHHLTVELNNLIGQRLYTLRTAAALPPAEAASILAASERDIVALERGERPISEAELDRLLTLYGVQSAEQRALIGEVARGEHAHAWWLRYFATMPPWVATMLAAEADSRVIRAYGAEAVPALLQTEAYARAARQAAHRPDPAHDQVELAVRLVMDRQINPIERQSARLWVILREAALLDMPGGPDVQAEQLSHLIDLSKQENIALRINARHGERYQPRGGSFTLLQRLGRPNLVYVTGLVEDRLITRPEVVDEYLVAHLRLDMSAEREERTIEILTDIRRHVTSR
ncbi:hypothetical protein BKM31_17695 [[Actinomadura] parvosata subsp. kistnae]|uniref:HTH cro/C1-type domain-containing protein n=2 Tax=Nonomuraea TaxID=83681 RepID=A0A1U9ZYL7_9ACTN|nr:hypothetical protein BKM31_17695 [Nonomuraea sp. ATCC 55076]